MLTSGPEPRGAQEDEARGATYSGGGERHHVVLPSVPNYQEPDMDAFVARLEAAVGKPADQITDEDLTPEVAALALGVQTHEEAERRAAAEQEAMLIAEFRNRLDYNLGRVRRRGKGVGVLHSFPFFLPFLCV